METLTSSPISTHSSISQVNSNAELRGTNDQNDDDDDSIAGSRVSEVSTTSTVTGRRANKAWIHEYVKVVNGARFCIQCTLEYKITTATSTIARHLETHHGIFKPTVQSQVFKQQKLTDISILPNTVIRKIDSSIALYLVSTTLPHRHAESEGFTRLMKGLVPGYVCKSAETYKKRILRLYVYLRHLMVQIFDSLPSKMAITFDGWSTPQRKSLVSLTTHWIDFDVGRFVRNGAANGASVDGEFLFNCVGDFFYVLPGRGQGQRCGDYLYKFCLAMGIQKKVFATVNDNGSDAIVAAKRLGVNLGSDVDGSDNLPPQNQLRCLPHSVQLAVNSAYKEIAEDIASIRQVIKTVRGSKKPRQMFRDISKTMYSKEFEPPCLASETRWWSTLAMLETTLERRDALITVVQLSKDTFEGNELESVNWSKISSIIIFLKPVQEVCDMVGGELYPSMSVASAGYDLLLEHSKSHQFNQDTNISAAASAMLEYLEKYDSILMVPATAVARFLNQELYKPKGDDEYEQQLRIVKDIFMKYKDKYRYNVLCRYIPFHLLTFLTYTPLVA